MSTSLRKIVIVGGSRIPFCRANTLYADQSNQDMLTRAIQGVVDRYALDGKQMDQVMAGAVTTHSKDWNLAREAVLSTTLSPLTPAVTLQQACGTSLQAALLAGSQIAAGQIECAIVAGTDTTSDVPVVFQRRFAQRLVALSRARSFGQKLSAFKGFSLSELAPQPPRNAEPRTGLSMGQHCERMAKAWEISRAEQDELTLKSHLNAAAAWDSGFFDDLVVSHNGVIRDNIVRPDTSSEKLASLKPAFDRKNGTLTAGNSTTLSDGAAAVLLCSEDWARANNLPISAYLSAGRSAAVDYVDADEGLLMAPTVAVAEMLQRAGLGLSDFDFYEIHEAFAAQVLCTLKSWESEKYCRERLGLDKPLGWVDRSKMNVRGGSVAIGHPFAATGARILATLTAILEQAGSGRGLISVCTAGGMGIAAIVERPAAASTTPSGRAREQRAETPATPETAARPSKKRVRKKAKKKTATARKRTATGAAPEQASDSAAPSADAETKNEG